MTTLGRGDCTLHYDVIDLTPPWSGRPDTVLFCHGVATNADIWSTWLPTLAGRHRLVRFDTRGFGRSSEPAADGGWSMDLLADDILAVAEATGTERFHLVGESMGGTAALHLAARRPGQVASLTVCSTSHVGGSIRRVRGWREFIAQSGMEAWSLDMMPKRFAPNAVPQRVHDWFHRVQAATSPTALLAAADLLVHTDLSGSLERIAVPTLILAPDSTPFIPIEVPCDLHRRTPVSDLQVFPGVRHGLACSHGTQCAEAMLAFLDRHGLA